MRALLITVVISFTVVLFNCGSGSIIFAPPSDTPAISNLSLSSGCNTVGCGGGTTTVTLTYEFSDPDADIDMVTVMWTPTQGTLGWTQGTAGVHGLFNGAAAFGVTGIPTTSATTYTFVLYVFDDEGVGSNVLTGQLTIS